jgi:hypothetical protein
MHLSLILNFNSNTELTYRDMLSSFSTELGFWKRLKKGYVKQLCAKPEHERRITALNIQGASKRCDTNEVLAILAAQLNTKPENLIEPVFDLRRFESITMRALTWARVLFYLAEWLLGELHKAPLHIKPILGRWGLLRN